MARPFPYFKAWKSVASGEGEGWALTKSNWKVHISGTAHYPRRQGRSLAHSLKRQACTCKTIKLRLKSTNLGGAPHLSLRRKKLDLCARGVVCRRRRKAHAAMDPWVYFRAHWIFTAARHASDHKVRGKCAAKAEPVVAAFFLLCIPQAALGCG